ncbi:MAG: 50S ribosomal protein L6 [Patescibacteria group bacterium]|nr:50S ribosomal protein L6 [Patescibacteria group bacterium]
MSRIGKLPIKFGDEIEINLKEHTLEVKGPKGKLEQKIHSHISLDIKDDEIVVKVRNPQEKKDRALWGLFRALIDNMVQGVKEGFEKKLEINGVGYKAKVSDHKLTLNLGYSHSIEYNFPEDIEIKVDKNIVTVAGPDRQKVGQVAAEIRRFRKPEPYKGKGIKYVDEVIRRKAGKAAKGDEDGA